MPWWSRGGGFDGDGEGDDDGDGGGGQRSWQLAGKTDATGAHVMHLDFLSAKPALPMSVTASASVTDVNRQTWSASSAMIVHPSQLYVGLKTKKPFVEKGQPFEIEVIGVDLDGKAATDAKIEVKAVRLDWEYKKGEYATKEVDPQTCAVIAAKDARSCSFATKEGGTYQVMATIVDAKGRPNQTKLDFWVTGGDQPPARDVEQERVQLIPDKKEYRGGDVAELLVQAPFYPAEAVVSWRRSGIVKTERIQHRRPDEGDHGADHRRDGAEHVRAGRPGRRGGAARRPGRSGSEAAEAAGVRGGLDRSAGAAEAADAGGGGRRRARRSSGRASRRRSGWS